MKGFTLLLLLSSLFVGCTLFQRTYIYTNNEYIAFTKNTNVCGMLKDSVVVYPIFIDVNQFHPWTSYDIDSTLDSLHKAMNWLEKQAKANSRPLVITTELNETKGKLSVDETKIKPKTLTLNLDLLKSVHKKDINSTDHWADKIATYVAKGTDKPSEGNVATKNKVTNLERFIARLRNQYQTDNVALMYFVNGYFEQYPSVSLHTYTSGPEVEYCIITNKNPAIIAHEFLHLFGAVDLYPNSSHPTFNFKEIQEAYPNEIMLVQHKHIESLTISPITKYYIGWQNDLNQMNTRLLYHTYNVIEY